MSSSVREDPGDLDVSARYYAARFAKLHTDTSASRWSERTRHRAPHKPLLLLAVIDLFASGMLTTNLIELTPELCRLFFSYSRQVMPPGHPERVFLPFIHLRADGFWHLVPQPSQEDRLARLGNVWSVVRLREIVLGAQLDDDLFQVLSSQIGRELLRPILIETYFAPDVQTELIHQGRSNLDVFRYSQVLLNQARGKAIQETGRPADAYQSIVRSEGFRRAVVVAYEYRCALCGIRILTADGHSVVDSVYIVPPDVRQDDRPTNGLALCQLCRWAFAEGLAAISKRYTVMLSRQLSAEGNVPGHLTSLAGRGMLGPEEPQLWPDPDALSWHREKTFRA